MMKPFVIGVDPSGSFKEGKGTTGIVILDPDGNLIEHTIVDAKDWESQTEYWNAILEYLKARVKQLKEVVLSVEDYVLYASSAKAQINSEMETSKLIGAITMLAYYLGIPLYTRSASQVMNRWTNDILEFKGYIKKKGRTYTDVKGEQINHHCLDALRHAVHCYNFEIDKKKGVV